MSELLGLRPFPPRTPSGSRRARRHGGGEGRGEWRVVYVWQWSMAEARSFGGYGTRGVSFWIPPSPNAPHKARPHYPPEDLLPFVPRWALNIPPIPPSLHITPHPLISFPPYHPPKPPHRRVSSLKVGLSRTGAGSEPRG
ncbi:hypothetical protein Pcinc_027079 [Petrolisthes cinctipes]|uniref:Uncharacterized protein n=1 Tax=Petrolisthes cinctipes TaxID=88211 RepID=A0AAE1KBB8_PETCI|nr:hypothetical protein Pcinc_027079 [Petrolisthes cinctipes]